MSLSRLEQVINLLHTCPEASLATHSQTLPGYPFASVVTFFADEHQHPVLLLSGLAEHTRNLGQDARVSLLLARSLGAGEVARVTILGDIVPLAVDPLLTARCLRYQPHAERLLQFGDFGFWRIVPRKILAVGGFAQAGWLEAARLETLSALSLRDEAECLERLLPAVPDAYVLLGIDPYGIDLRGPAGRMRLDFPAAPLAADAVHAAATTLLSSLTPTAP